MNDRRRVEELFEAARRIDPERRAAYLDDHCDGDEGLRDEVLSLLEFDRPSGTILDSAVFQRETLGDRDAPGLPEDFGGYRFLEPLGSGGFGDVYLVEQSSVERRFALKLIKPGMDSQRVLARFDTERMALSVMDHPGISRIIDAGTTPRGRPYFTMEFIDGLPITQYCDREQLSVAARIELVIEVCRAVHHAHQKGIIHRDLKPSNILVTEEDGRAARPVVIDFGIAKALEDSGDGSAVTETRVFLGTPDYVSPEQVGWGRSDIDTRSDVYSLGVLLYEILTGATPLDLRSTAGSDVQRVIHEKDPLRPSARVHILGADVETVATHRGLDPRALRRAFAGDIDAIVLKCLEKDRRRRYPSAIALGEDLSRYLEDEPVLARSPGVHYRVGKFVRRHRLPVLGFGVLLIALISGLVIASFGLVEAHRGRESAELEARRAVAVREFFVRRMLDAANPALGGGAGTPIGELLDGAAREIGSAFADDPPVEASVRVTLAHAYREL
ncbi:MAG: serine/threonine protein kinase, partial [Planctomycetes bacterium]|nr:serine/threonine protein kinase [Planctomycetota bacterium]